MDVWFGRKFCVFFGTSVRTVGGSDSEIDGMVLGVGLGSRLFMVVE